MPPVFTSVETVAQALIYHPHSSPKRLARIIAEDPDRYGPALSLDTVYEVLKRLRELNLVRVHFDDDGALYEFGNQPHPVFVCVQCDRDSARQDMLFNYAAGPFFQPSSTKDGRTKLTPNHTLLHLIEFCDFIPFTYRFEVLGYCRVHADDTLLQFQASRFLQFLLRPEEQFLEFRLALALKDPALIRASYATAKKLMDSAKVGTVVTRIFDKPTQYLADRLEPLVERMKADVDDLLRRVKHSDPQVSQAATMAFMLYDQAIQRKLEEVARRQKENATTVVPRAAEHPP